MVLLAVLVMLGAAATAADIVVQNTAVVHGVVFGQSVGSWSAGQVFVAGCVLGIVFALAAWASLRAWAWRRRRRRAAAARLAEAHAHQEALRAENARLQEALGTGEPGAQTQPYPADPATTAVRTRR